MSEVDLSQQEADRLLALEKHRVSDEAIRFPHPRRRALAKLLSANGKEEFIIDMYFGDVDFPRFSIQLRARQAIVLARLELDGPVHENPDGDLIPTPHPIFIVKAQEPAGLLLYPQTSLAIYLIDGSYGKISCVSATSPFRQESNGTISHDCGNQAIDRKLS